MNEWKRAVPQVQRRAVTGVSEQLILLIEQEED